MMVKRLLRFILDKSYATDLWTSPGLVGVARRAAVAGSGVEAFGGVLLQAVHDARDR